MKPRDRLRVAMQKSGRLTEPALELLTRCGLTFRQSRDKLFCFGEGEPVDLLLVRDDDIPGLIAQGVCDLGIVGRNVLKEFQLTTGLEAEPLVELRSLGFGRCRLSIAVPQELDYQMPRQLEGLRIATTYPGLLGEWLRTQGVNAGVVTLAGSVEIAPKLGTADAICDLVQSGGTLVANQLRETDVLLQSEAVLAGPEALPTVAVEALAAGTPVLSSDNPGGLELNDLFGHMDVAIVPREDPLKLAAAITHFLQHKRRTMATTQAAIERDFRPSAVAAQYRAIYDDVMAQPDPAEPPRVHDR